MLCQLKSTAPLLLLIVLLCYYVSADTTTVTAANNNINSSTKTTSTPPTFVPHRFTSSNNITILHEVHEYDDDDQQPKLVLNTHEVLPTKKPVKKKPYTLLEKTFAAEFEKPRPLKEYELHPVTFDFNLGDLEDLETHDPLKKDELDVIIDPNVLRNEGVLSDEAGDGGLSYTELPALLQDAVVGDDATVAKDATGLHVTIVTTTTSGTTAALIDNATTTTTTTSVPLLSLDLPTTITISPHIFKVLKTTKSKVKGRELLKKDAPLGFNSISRLAAHQSLDDSLANATAESWQSSVNQFQLLINLYDHFYWHPSDIRHKVTTGCGIEMQAYLTALNSNLEWAQRAYDASGRYRGQMFYGNDKWLGEKAFCYELNRQLKPEERKHFEFEFNVALVSIQIWLPGKLDVILQLGECLPKTCTPQDVQAILALDPHAHMLMALNAANSTNPTQIAIRRMRKVPGDFSYWLELKFQIFISFMFSLTALVIISTWYQAKLNRRKCATAANMADMRTEVSTVHRSMGNGDNGYNGKAFELYQMSTLSDNNNVDVEADLNGNKNHQHQQQQHNTNSSCSNGSKRTETNGHSTVSSTVEKSSEAELKAQIAADYRIETCSSAGATGTYEAKQKLGLHQQVLLCFAFQTNASVIMNIDDNKETQTSCVHGLRVFSVLWTIMVHTYLQMFTIAENRFTRIIVERSIWYQFVGNATFSVDTFFFISGFLVTLLYLKQDKKYPEATGQFMRKSIVDTLVIVIYRYIRLTPAYLFVILFNDFSLRQTFDASVFQPTIGSETCSGYWWRNILYINNFYPLSEICMIWSWYMANDMQFYIMASVLLVLSTRYFKAVALIVCTFLFSSWGLSGIISLHYNYTHKVANPFESFDFLYDKPWQRVGTYIMGMLAGYIFHKVKSPPKITSRTNLLLWAGSIGLLFIIIFGVWNGELNVISTAFYVSMGHTAFGLALIWIVLSCCWGFANPVNRVLSYRGLWPLSRLTYCTYLIHPLIMLLTSFRMEGTVHLNNLFVLTIFLGNAVVSFFVAFFISVLFEAPVIRLLKIFFRK